MISIRRYVTYVAFAACLVFIFSYLLDPSISFSRNEAGYDVSGRDPSYFAAFTDPDTGRLRWDLVPVRYPVNSPIPLPTTPPQKLPRVQHEFFPETNTQATKRKERQAAVKKTFEQCWQVYKKGAWMKDEVAPISGGFSDLFGGWAATLVDSLDALWIMGFKQEFDEAVAAAVDIDLSQSTTQQINVFETTIRHLGGFLSAYDLSGDERLLQKAREFGDMLIVAFDTPNRMPITRWYPYSSFERSQAAGPNVLVAEIGSLSMEFTRLSIVTGDPKWYDAVKRIIDQLEKQQNDTFLPGMWPVTINARDMDFAGDSLFTLSAMSDSLYEYFPKMHALLGGIDPVYKKLYAGSMDLAIEYNLFRPLLPDEADVLVSGQIRKLAPAADAQLDPQGQHLVCFAGGMFALGSKLFDIPDHLNIGRKITNGCIWTYKAMPLGIMPEKFRMMPCESKQHCSWNETRWLEGVAAENPGDENADEAIKRKRIPQGFTELTDTRYVLRPEAIESVFILYRITGDEELLEVAWEMFDSIVSATKTPLGANAALDDVSISRTQLGFLKDANMVDSMESFWLAETLKYFYLIFSEPDVISLDEWVFNTEAHPFRRRLPDG